ncbi:MAG: LamG-like jellyroll fold domain-containing protein, partial [Bacteroidota bacterium]|nr:LamG-like jellyroll fold domain-containing protein [Bacteroidota bacterium]
TNAEILEPLNNWVVNVRDQDTMTVRIGNYNLAHQSFQSLRFEYKASSGNIWVPVKYFVNDPLLANKDEIADTILINNQTFVSFDWDMTNMNDRSYGMRVVSTCTDYSENESAILTGILDGQRPQVFGTPQPADGILNVDENISLRFNEPIEGGLLNQFNFDVKGTLNYYLLKHEAYLRFNGSTDYASIQEGLAFNNKSFTIEFWVKPIDYGNSVIFSQGNDPATSLEIGLKDGFKTYFKIGNLNYEVPFQFSPTVPSEAWQHLAYVFDYETGDVFIYQNDKIILEVRGASVAYNNSGKIYIGKSSVTGAGYFEGSIHELRIWSKYLSLGDVYARQYTALSGNEVSLYGYWPMDEAFGKLAIDKAASRHMEINVPWGVYPGGSSWDFSGNNFLEFNTGYFAIIPEMDYTLEFWFKDNNPTDTVTMFSNQKGDGKEGPNLMEKTLSVYATPDGKIWVASQGKKIEVVTKDYFDNSWHHFALVVRRRGNVTSFIDGQPQNEKENTIIGGIAGGKMTLGARKWNNINGTGQDRFYTGKLDEFRLWDLAKTTTQLRMDMNSKLKGDEIGLMVYLPLEGYYEDALGVVQQQTTLENFVSDVNALNALPVSGNAFSLDAPNMKDVRPVQSIAYDFVSSEDEIIINPKPYLFPQLEKNIIEITVQGVEDKYGNRLASPVTWTAYVHRNQVRWEDERRSFTKELYKTMTFESTIKNTGGQQIGFEIIGLPPWLSASPSTGVINPESTRVITLTINPAINIGEYNADIILRTANGFDEKLPVSVKVFKTPPSWKVNPSAFEHTMNMVGRIKIEGVLSTDVFDMVAAFKEGTDSIRGVANIRYLENLDSYMVFMNVYGNANGEKLTFRVWDASAGQILDKVLPDDVVFVPNGVNGTTTNPVIFTAINLYRSYIPLAAGWNWVSFNKLSPDQNNLNAFMSSIESKQNDQIKTHGGGFNNYDPLLGWSFGGIESINNNLMYQIKLSKTDTLIYNGTYIEPEAHQMTLANGWNHVAYIPDLLMDVNEALRLYSASAEEIIKSQYAFAMFDPRVGWIGTLEFMKPGFGYMIKTNKTATLKYPNTSLLKDAKIEKQSAPPSGWSANLVKYEGNMSVIARLETSKFPEVLINDQMVLGAFINKECHGYTVPITNSGIDYSPFFLNVSNDKTEQQVQFRLYDGLSGKTYQIEETKVYAENAVYGSTLSPQILTLKGQYTGLNGELVANTTLNCYPNPFNEGLTIDYNFAGGLMKLEIMDLTGRVINKLFEGISEQGLKSIVWDGKSGNGTAVSAGMYYVRLSAGNSVETVKITKNR